MATNLGWWGDPATSGDTFFLTLLTFLQNNILEALVDIKLSKHNLYSEHYVCIL